MTEDGRIEEAAKQLLDDQRMKRDLADLSMRLRPHSFAEAYAIQDRLLENLCAGFDDAIAGWKIALTTPAMQRIFGIDHPCEGAILASQVHTEQSTLRSADFVSLAVEPEFAVRLDRDLGPDGSPYDRNSVEQGIGELMLAIELVDTRNSNADNSDGPLLIADNVFSRGGVLGKPVANWRNLDLGEVGVRLLVNGDEVGRGVGRDVLGHPLEALAWLADSLIARGRQLRAGDIVLTGSVVPLYWAQPGDVVVGLADEFDDVRVSVQ